MDARCTAQTDRQVVGNQEKKRKDIDDADFQTRKGFNMEGGME